MEDNFGRSFVNLQRAAMPEEEGEGGGGGGGKKNKKKEKNG